MAYDSRDAADEKGGFINHVKLPAGVRRSPGLPGEGR